MKYEYATMAVGQDAGVIARLLNERSQDGWRGAHFVSISKNRVLIVFERPRPEELTRDAPVPASEPSRAGPPTPHQEPPPPPYPEPPPHPPEPEPPPEPGPSQGPAREA
jgi:hypothetical protein